MNISIRKIKSEHKESFLVFLIMILAIISRIYGTWEWGLYLDEICTYDVALNKYNDYFFSATYLLTSIFFKLFGTSEFTTRLSSILFGILSFPALYLVTKKIFGKTTAVISVLFLLFSSYHLDQSQYARSYSATFFWGALAYFFFYQYLQTNHKKMLVYALLTSACGVMFNPPFLLVILANAVFSLCVIFLKPLHVQKKTVDASKRLVLILGIGGILLLPFAIKTLLLTESYQATFLSKFGYSSFKFALQLIKYFSIPITIMTLFGLLCIIKENILKGIYFAVAILTPLIIIFFASLAFDVGPSYLMYTYPLFFMLSASFISQIKKNEIQNSSFSILLTIAIVVCLLPEFVSHYAEKKSFKIHEAIEFIEKSYNQNDKILSILPSFNFYAGEKFKFEPFLFAATESSLQIKLEKYKNNQYRLWIVLEEPRDGINRNLKEWLLNHSKLVWESSVKRFDYSFKTIRIYLKE